MADSNTSDSWGTAAVTVQQSSAPSSHWQHLPCKCVLHPAFPIPIRNRRGGQPCWCTSWTIISPPILHSQASAESPVTQLQLWGGTVHLNSSQLGLPQHPTPPTAPFLCLSWYSIRSYLIPGKKEHLSQQVSWAPPGSVCCSLFADLLPFIRPAWSLITSWC